MGIFEERGSQEENGHCTVSETGLCLVCSRKTEIPLRLEPSKSE